MQTTSPETNIQLIRTLYADFNAGDVDACTAHVSSDLVINVAEMAEPVHGRDIWRQGTEGMIEGFSDIHARIDDIIAADDRVAARVTFGGTHDGEFLGIPATGRYVEYVSHTFFRIADGLVAEEWVCTDTATLLLRQLHAGDGTQTRPDA